MGTEQSAYREPVETYQHIVSVVDDEDLVLDYFHFDDSPTRLQFHRSVATLPTVPIKNDSDLNESSNDETDIMLARNQIWLHWLVPVPAQDSCETRGQVSLSKLS